MIDEQAQQSPRLAAKPAEAAALGGRVERRLQLGLTLLRSSGLLVQTLLVCLRRLAAIAEKTVDGGLGDGDAPARVLHQSGRGRAEAVVPCVRQFRRRALQRSRQPALSLRSNNRCAGWLESASQQILHARQRLPRPGAGVVQRHHLL